MNICIFCEGKTEANYIRSLNRLLNNNNIYDLNFTVKVLGGLSVNNYISLIKNKKYRSGNLKYFDRFYYWLDFDIFKRAGKDAAEIIDKISKICFNKKHIKPLLNYMNGEDCRILHEEPSKIEEWKSICNENNHFEKPMDDYEDLFEGVIRGYKKGAVCNLDIELIKLCVKNSENNKIPFRSDIIEILKIVICKIENS